ncbi:MAG: hypothetical protein ACR2QX_02610 [Woeseiaceae bacterium]
MERLLQYLDDLDDLYGAVGLLAERLRTFLWLAGLIVGSSMIGITGVVVTLNKPPLGLAMAILLFVWLLYRAVTQPILAETATYEPA